MPRYCVVDGEPLTTYTASALRKKTHFACTSGLPLLKQWNQRCNSNRARGSLPKKGIAGSFCGPDFIGNRLKYQIKCARKNATSDAEFTYSGDRYEGVVTIKNDDVGEIRQVYTARRIGDCETAKDE